MAYTCETIHHKITKIFTISKSSLVSLCNFSFHPYLPYLQTTTHLISVTFVFYRILYWQNLSRKAFSFSPLHILAMGLLYMAFIMLNMFPLYTVCWEFYHEWMLDFVKCLFCIYWDDHMLLKFILLMCCFTNHTLHSFCWTFFHIVILKYCMLCINNFFIWISG